MIITAEQKRDLNFQNKHDAIYASLDRVPNWMVYGHLSFTDEFEKDEKLRLNKFHLLIRDFARRFAGKRDLNSIGWFLNQEGRGKWKGKRFHFHFILTDDKLKKTSPEVVCRYLNKQWQKISKSECYIEPWDETQRERGIWYVTQNEDSSLPHSKYFHGEFCHWKMSTLLHSKILAIANQSKNYENI